MNCPSSLGIAAGAASNIGQRDVGDVTLDEPLMQLVFTGALPDGAPPEEYPRLLAAAKQLRAADGGRLLMVDAWGRERVIPPICER